MGDPYWNRQQQQPLVPSPGMQHKRPRPDYEADPPTGLPSGSEAHNYQVQEDERSIRVVKDTNIIGSAYDRYLQSTLSSPNPNPGEANSFPGAGHGRAGATSGGLPSFPVADLSSIARAGALLPDLALIGRNNGFNGQLPGDIMPITGREPVHLPPDASPTLYVEGLPTDITKREVAHIFRPFVGYKEVRLVTKESKHRGGDPLTFCFVDFVNPPCAATAMSALQGYKMDEHEPDSAYLRLQFARNPPRAGARLMNARR